MSHESVDAWMAAYDNPMKEVVQRIRHMILAADDRITEDIKWQAPTFMYEGNLASFYPKSMNYATLMFHQGALIPGNFPHLQGQGTEARAMKIVSIAEAEERRDELEEIIRAWIALREESLTNH
ncbi:DUF1801 domain-containing protein [Demequina aurantiaca]|uniref:DUF1801 domain-containing protein n=1 Tax=Demequina aurantiaca TaxID=676200 RepID=UPI0007820166|nr:DUF1801 domain-containing protein [Demequina aurantiaca]